MSLESEIKRANDAIIQSKTYFENASILQKKHLNTIMKMSYYLGMLEYSKEHDKIRQAFLSEDEDEDE